MSRTAERATCIAVCGPGNATDDEVALAEAVGRLIGERGCTLVCGGLGGAMAAACRGARDGGGVTIGIVLGYDGSAANPWVDHVICTGLGQVRNALVVASGQAVIAVGGGWGTLSEIGLALRIGRPVVLLRGWSELLASDEGRARISEIGGDVLIAGTPDEAVKAAIAATGRSATRSAS